MHTDAHSYKHGVIQPLIADPLLIAVRAEIQASISFTPKETDIYRIHQSGDLANLSGLDDASLARLPSLVTLRDALYSPAFRAYVSAIAGAGPLSGSRTDMAVNVYTDGCHLLCHDDVIGSRRVSYILYLTDPDEPWRAEWGGALRLYPTEPVGVDGADTGAAELASLQLPSAQWSKAIPPAWNQLSFFAVQPGQSFHDVEEVYAPGFERHAVQTNGNGKSENGDHGQSSANKANSDNGTRPAAKGPKAANDGGPPLPRVRMAISGWYHIPQRGEVGFVEGAEERQAERSSRAQLQGKADRYDLPQKVWLNAAGEPDASAAPRDGPSSPPPQQHQQDGDAPADVDLTEADLTFLLRYMNARYLTPDTVAELAGIFADASSLRLGAFLNAKYAAALRARIAACDGHSETQPDGWHVARPPHKHRFLYRGVADVHGGGGDAGEADVERDDDPVDELLTQLLPSAPFRAWLALATGCALQGCSVLARRFRPGLDYTLATAHEGEAPRLELCLGMTPTRGWGDDEEEEEEEEDEQVGSEKKTDGARNASDVGGYEVYMVGEDDEDANDAGDGDGVEERAAHPASHTGAGKRRSGKVDPAVYAGGGDADGDDGVLFSMPACWNTVSVVLRDKGVLRFVKYVGARARGARWDLIGEWGVVDEDDEDENGEEEEVRDLDGAGEGDGEEEEEEDHEFEA